MNLLHSPPIVYFHDMNSQRLLDAIEKIQNDLNNCGNFWRQFQKTETISPFSFSNPGGPSDTLWSTARNQAKNVELAVRMSYKEAMARGFKGSFEQWRHLSADRAGKSFRLSIPLLQPAGANRTF